MKQNRLLILVILSAFLLHSAMMFVGCVSKTAKKETNEAPLVLEETPEAIKKTEPKLLVEKVEKKPSLWDAVRLFEEKKWEASLLVYEEVLPSLSYSKKAKALYQMGDLNACLRKYDESLKYYLAGHVQSINVISATLTGEYKPTDTAKLYDSMEVAKLLTGAKRANVKLLGLLQNDETYKDSPTMKQAESNFEEIILAIHRLFKRGDLIIVNRSQAQEHLDKLRSLAAELDILVKK